MRKRDRRKEEPPWCKFAGASLCYEQSKPKIFLPRNEDGLGRPLGARKARLSARGGRAKGGQSVFPEIAILP